MRFRIMVKNRSFAANSDGEGVFELINGAYLQHRGTGQTPRFTSADQFRRYVQRMLRHEV